MNIRPYHSIIQLVTSEPISISQINQQLRHTDYQKHIFIRNTDKSYYHEQQYVGMSKQQVLFNCHRNSMIVMAQLQGISIRSHLISNNILIPVVDQRRYQVLFDHEYDAHFDDYFLVRHTGQTEILMSKMEKQIMESQLLKNYFLLLLRNGYETSQFLQDEQIQN